MENSNMNTEAKKLGIHFGAMVEPIAKQLKEQGFAFDKNKIDVLQKLCDAVTLLKVHNIIPESVGDKCRKNLIKKIEKAIVYEN